MNIRRYLFLTLLVLSFGSFAAEISDTQTTTGGGGQTIDVAEPGTVVNGDIIAIWLASQNSGSTWTPPAEGLTEQHDETISGGSSALYTKDTATGSETWTMQFSTTNFDGKGAVAVRITDNDGINIAGTVDTGFSGSTFSTPQVTTTVDGCLIVHFVYSGHPLTNITDPAGVTIAGEVEAGAGTDSIIIAYETQATAGLTTQRTWSHTGFNGYMVNTIAIAPAASSGSIIPQVMHHKRQD